MSVYISQLRKASFRGISFEVPQDDKGFGRRVQTYEYPGRDTPGHDDMGAAVNVINVTAIIGGMNFLADADALERALNKKGAGTLVHPHYGEVQVIVKDSPRRSHSASAVGDVIFTITFEKAGERSYPSALGDTALALELSGRNLYAALKGDFTDRLLTNLLPDYVTSDGIARINSLVEGARSVLQTGGLAGLFTFPTFETLGLGIVDSVIGLFQDITASAKPSLRPAIGNAPVSQRSNATQVMRAMSKIVNASGTPVTGAATQSTSVRQQNADAIDGMFKGAAAACLASTARYAIYESREEAIAVRNSSYDSISNLRDFYGVKGWDASWQKTGGAMSAVSRDINDRIGRLPRTLLVKPATVRTSLDLAQRLYGDDPTAIFARADDLAKRNKIRHPAFMPPVKLEALIDGN